MWKEPYVYVANFLPLTQSATGDAFQDFPIKIAGDSHFEILRSIHKADSNLINLKLINSSNNDEIIRPHGDLRSVSSTAFNGLTANGFVPYNFPKPYLISADSEFLVQAADKSNGVGGNKLRLALHGNKLYGGEAPYANRKEREAASIPIDSGSIAAYDTATKVYVLDSDAGFLVSKLTGDRTGSGLISIQDVRPWSSQDVHFDNMVGNAQFGNNLTAKRWISDRVKLTIRFTDLSGSTNRFKITFHGERVYA